MTTGTVGKSAGAVLMDIAASPKGTVDASGFQKVWNNQMNKDSMGGTVKDNTADAKGKQASADSRIHRGDSLKAKEVRAARSENPGDGELSAEELEQAAGVIDEAAVAMMQQIADVFGVSMEEVQAAMEELGLEEAGVLEVSGLNSLLLKLGGAQDSSALLMDEELYANYRTLMDGLNRTLEGCARELGVEPEKLVQLLEEGTGIETGPDVNLETEAVLEPKTRVSVPTASGQDEEDIILTGESAADTQEVQDALQKGQDAQGQADGQTRGEGKRTADRNSHGGSHEVAFGQNFRMEQFQPETAQAQAAAHDSAWDVETRNIMNQIMDYMRLRLNGDASNLEMQLHPASLGTLQIQIASKGGVVTANFITQNEAVKAALESQMIELKERFEEQGVKVEAIEVTVQTHEFERNLEQGRGREQQTPEKRGRARRIQPGGAVSMEDPQEEDTLRSGMLAVEGSTVDYTA